MRKTILLLGFIFVGLSSAFAQEVRNVEQQSLWKIGLVGPNIEYEAKISPDFTLRSELGSSLSFGYLGSTLGWEFEYGLIATTSPRYYYNLDERYEDGKTVKDYSGNYISFVSTAYLNSILSTTEEPNKYIFGPTWGLQRSWGESWYFNFEIGPGVSISKELVEFTPVIGLDIGFKL